MVDVLIAPFRFLVVYVLEPLTSTLSHFPVPLGVLGYLALILGGMAVGGAMISRAVTRDPGGHS
jgi:hypothetical protein